MENLIPEKEARELLLKYEGFNNQILDWKLKMVTNIKYNLTRTQSEYVIKYYNVVPKIAKKHITITKNFAETLMKDKNLSLLPEKIWCEKLLCESDNAYHIWGKLNENQNNYAIWLPKFAIIQEEKKLNRVIDYSPYSHRAPMNHQKEAIEKLLSNNKFILADDMGVGKAELVNNEIFTPYGRKRIGDIIVGDKIIGSDGESYNVTGRFPQGVIDTYQVTFNDGFSVIVGAEHLWCVSSNNSGDNSKNRENRYITLSTEQMLDKDLKLKQIGTGLNEKRSYEFSTYYKSPNGNNKWQIPIVKPINFENNNELPIEPYLLGLCLGDGHFTNSSCVFTVHKDDYDELFENFNLKENKSQDNKRKGNLNIGEPLRDLKLDNTRSHNKFIPEIYKYSSIENRLAILQGLMDTDGHCSFSKNGTFHSTEYSTISEKLCDDVCEIVQTLGGIARKKSRRSFIKKMVNVWNVQYLIV